VNPCNSPAVAVPRHPASQPQRRHSRSAASIAALLLLFVAGPALRAQDATASETRGSALRLTASIGIGGHVRLQRWTPLRITVENLPATADVRLIVRCPDLDGAIVEQAAPLSESADRPDGEPLRVWRYVQLPQSYSAVELELQQNDGQTLLREMIRINAEQLVPPAIPFVVWLGAPLSQERLQSTTLLSRRREPVQTSLATNNELPDDPRGWEAVDLILMTGGQASLVESITPPAQEALKSHILQGGRLLLAAGSSAPAFLSSAQWVGPLVPQLTGAAPQAVAAASVEAFVSAQEPLSDNPLAAGLDAKGNRVLLPARNLDREAWPAAVEHLSGFGRTLVLGLDLDQPPIADWASRFAILEKLVPEVFALEEIPPVTEAGYNDLAGQLHESLDRFNAVGEVPFSWLALMLLGYAAVVGPLDYWLVNRPWRRPWLTWITFPMVVVLLSTTIWSMIVRTRPAIEQINALTVVDFAPRQRVMRVRSWQQVLVPRAERLDLRVVPGPWLPQPLGGWVSWRGRGAESIQGARFVSAQAAYQLAGRQTVPSDQPAIVGLPLAPGATRGLDVGCSGPWSTELESNLVQIAGSDLLRGGFRNPLSSDLYDGVLIYRNWVYTLPKTVPAGGRVEDVSLLVQKNFRWRLSRRQLVGGGSESEPWDPLAANDLERLAEMLLFHDAAGGTKYSRLTHRWLSTLDLSFVLSHETAILMGRTLEPGLQLVRADSGSMAADREVSLARVLLPVEIDTSPVPEIDPKMLQRDGPRFRLNQSEQLKQ